VRHDWAAAAPAGAGAILELQRLAGNRATALVIQRRDEKGLAAKRQVAGVTSRWLKLWRAHRSSTVETLLDAMGTELNRHLRSVRVHPVDVVPRDSGPEGGFRHQEWKISINVPLILGVAAGAKVSTVATDKVAALADSLYHEARHAEQSFSVARSRASMHPDAERLAIALEIPVEVAAAARRAGAPGPDDPAKADIDAWAAFGPGGRYHQYRLKNEALKDVTQAELAPLTARTPSTVDGYHHLASDINRKVTLLSPHWKLFFDLLHDVAKQPSLGPLDQETLKHLRAVTSAFNKLVLEVDGFRTAVDRARAIGLHPKVDASAMTIALMEANQSRLGIAAAAIELYLAQHAAYEAYPQEIDARKAGEAAGRSFTAGASRR
jgi:hypothetical protein